MKTIFFKNQLKQILDRLSFQKFNEYTENTLINILYENFYLNINNFFNIENGIKTKFKEKYIRSRKVTFIKNYNDLSSLIKIEKKNYLVKNETLIKNYLYRHKTIDITSSIYYNYFYSNEVDENFPEALVRFYINCKFEFSSNLIFTLMKNLNSLKIAFSIKSFKNQANFNRSDNIILFVYKYDWEKYYQKLFSIFHDNVQYFNQNIPLFTYPVCFGVGFGENPLNQEDSYGILRCKLLSNAILSNKNEVNLEKLLSLIIENLKKKGYDINKFYLNPKSKFPYKL